MYTKWVEAYALPDQHAITVADILATEYISRHGMFDILLSDQGRQFEGSLFTQLCDMLQIQKRRTVAFHARCNGLVERFNGTLQSLLKTVVNSQRNDWDDWLPWVLMSFRASPSESTGISPFKMCRGYEMRLPLDVMVGQPRPHEGQYSCEVEYISWLRNTLRESHDIARRHLKVAAQRQKTTYDRKSKPTSFQVGDLVWRWYPPIAQGKLSKGWVGPFQVSSKSSDVNLDIQRRPNGPIVKVHIDQLKKFHGDPAEWQGSDVEQEVETEESDRDKDPDLPGSIPVSDVEESDSSPSHEAESSDGPDLGQPLAQRRRRRQVTLPRRYQDS